MASAAHTPQDSMHLRIKRQGTTFFMLCYPEQNVIEARTKIGQMIERDVANFRLMYKGMILEDEATIRAQQISSNDVVYLVYKIDGSEQFEKEALDDLDRLHAEFEAKSKGAS
uniref:Ubiquitin-like domain-containing protein n=1 Tax=Strombidinopsis acuminata TaxID=141414 RepID=A0A7S3U7Z7_9SPIT|mmetsp:Transcript_101903/g.263356  ORF Transcript_101903/g.263356 Transcript_101903/m.263356 type:complete len:113 (-) Transcript_101903:52-390(-)